ncbi:unnamed protein product [Brassica oleracea var. botrytis]
MTNRRQKLVEDRQTILGHRRFYADENSLPISTDLIYEIFLRLSPEYIGRCRQGRPRDLGGRRRFF